MSYSVTGIQTIPASFSYPGTEHTSAGVIRPQNTKDTVDVDFSGSDAAKSSTPDRFKILSSLAAVIPHAVSILPVKVPGVVEPLDTVTLSTADKVRNLRQQGEGDSQIATTLSLPIKEVQSDLHLETSQHLSFTVAPIVASLTEVAGASSQA